MNEKEDVDVLDKKEAARIAGNMLLEKAWEKLGNALWEGDVLSKFIRKPKPGMDDLAWRHYEAELRKLSEPIFAAYERHMREFDLLGDFGVHSENNQALEHVAVYEGIEHWMRREHQQTPAGLLRFPAVCNRNEDTNPYYGKDDDLSMIWLVEFYYCESAAIRLTTAKRMLDGGLCNAAILDAKLPYGKKLATAALELALKELDGRCMEAEQSSYDPTSTSDESYPITKDDCFYPFIDQWRMCPEEFPWGKYLTMPTVAWMRA